MNEFNNFHELIETQAKKYAEKIFFTIHDTKDNISFEHFRKDTNKVCNVLKKYGIMQKEKIAIIMSNRPEWMYYHFGCLKYGSVSAPVNTAMSTHEMIEIFERSGIDHLIIEQDAYEKIKKQINNVSNVKKIFGIDFSEENVIDFEAEFDDAEEEFVLTELPRKRDIAAITFSVGYTGKPKPVPQTNKFFIEQAMFLSKFFNVSSDDCFLCIQKLFRSDWYVYTLVPLFTGASIVLTRGFDKELFWEQVEEHNVSIVQGNPSHINMIIEHPEDLSKRKVSCLKTYICNSSSLSLDALNRFEQLCPSAIVCNCYGTSETGWIAMTALDKTKRRPESAGKILEHIGYKIIDEEGNELKEFEEGQLVITESPYMTTGYINLAQETRQRLRKDGFHTGDACIVDSNDYLYVKGRTIPIIIKDSQKVSPKEIDNVIQEHEMIEDSATIGVPDPILGEEIISFVVIKYGMHATQRDIIEHCKERLSPVKRPKKVIFIDKIPLTLFEKPNITTLRQLYYDSEKEKHEEKTVSVESNNELH